MQPSERHDQTKQYVKALFGPYFSSHDGLIELRFIGKTDQPVFSKFYHLEDFTDTVLDEIDRYNTTHDVFVGVNPRPLSQEKKEENIEYVIAFWADIDGKNFEAGKQEAKNIVDEFSVVPNIVVDSGHGFHCYWLLEEEIHLTDENVRLDIKQTLFGIAKTLKADPQPVFLNAMLRLPGTNNLKDETPLECKVVCLTMERQMREKLSSYKDTTYQATAEWDGKLPEFGTKNKVISLNSAEEAVADVQRLEIKSEVKNRIIHGTLLQGRNADRTNSGRDMSIICSLVACDYGYETIRSVFFNPFLKCSARIRRKGELALKWDVKNGVQFVNNLKIDLPPKTKRILEIKESPHISSAEKPYQINAFVVGDLLKGKEPAGVGFKHRSGDQYFFFGNEDKALMDVEGLDFYLYMRQRYGILKRDWEEIKDAVKTEIKDLGKEVEPRTFAHFDKKEYVLYVSNHMNTVYRLDGEEIKACDNGADGVFFEYDPLLAPFEFKSDEQVVNYFKREPIPERIVEVGEMKLKFPAVEQPLGLSLEKFRGSYLDRYLISRGNFGADERGLTEEDQRLLFLLYFYSLFFRALQQEKPIVCFVGLRESGKSFIVTSIGRIFFGDSFHPTPFAREQKDLAVLLGGSYFTVFDNLDSHVTGELLDVLCAAATGAREAKRKLFTDRGQVRFELDSWVAITSREPKFRRDDVVRRLLIFNTKELRETVGRTELWRSLDENRNLIMSEVLVNLNTMVKLLKMTKDDRSRPSVCHLIADWETLVKKMCSRLPESILLQVCLRKMAGKKSLFALEDEPIYALLYRLIYEEGMAVERKTAGDLYKLLAQVAEDTRTKEFEKKYKSSYQFASGMKNLLPDLQQEFDVVLKTRGKTNPTLYSIGPLEEEEEEGEEEDEEQSSEASEEDKDALREKISHWREIAKKRRDESGPSRKPGEEG